MMCEENKYAEARRRVAIRRGIVAKIDTAERRLERINKKIQELQNTYWAETERLNGLYAEKAATKNDGTH